MTEPEPEDETTPTAAPTQPEPMNAKDYLTFVAYIGGFVVFFYAIGALAKLVGT